MKYFLIGFLFNFAIWGCTADKNSMTLSGEVKGLKKGTLLLQKFDDTTLISVDSIQINGNAEFNFSKTIDSPEIYYLYIRLENGKLLDDRIAFFAEPGKIEIHSTLKNFNADAKITGSKNQESFEEYQKIMHRYIDKKLDLVAHKFKAKQAGQDSTVAAIELQEKNLMASKYLATINFALNHKNLELAPYLILTETFDAQIKYLDTVYNELSPKIKSSKYGEALESFIVERKKLDTL